MKKVATALALLWGLTATPAGAAGPYKLQLLVDIYSVLVRCAPLDPKYVVLGESVLGELEAEGYRRSSVAAAIGHQVDNAANEAECVALIQPLMATYLATPD